MSVAQLLFLSLENPEFDTRIEISRLILEEFWNVYMPLISIDETVNGNLSTFSDMIEQLPSMTEIEYNFPGIKRYLSYHLTSRDIDRHDYAYASWVAIGLLRYIGKDSHTNDFWYDAMG